MTRIARIILMLSITSLAFGPWGDLAQASASSAEPDFEDSGGAPDPYCAQAWADVIIPEDTLGPVVYEGVFPVLATWLSPQPTGGHFCESDLVDVEDFVSITVSDDEGVIEGEILETSQNNKAVLWRPTDPDGRLPKTGAMAQISFLMAASAPGAAGEEIIEGEVALEVAEEPTPDMPEMMVVADEISLVSQSSGCEDPNTHVIWEHPDLTPGTERLIYYKIGGMVRSPWFGGLSVNHQHKEFSDTYCTQIIAHWYLDDRTVSTEEICHDKAEFEALLEPGQLLCGDEEGEDNAADSSTDGGSSEGSSGGGGGGGCALSHSTGFPFALLALCLLFMLRRKALRYRHWR
jgi:hypothetical protein